MAVTFTEPPESRPGRYGASGGGETILLNARGTDDQVELVAAVLAIPQGQPGGPIWDGFIRNDISWDLLGGGRAKVKVDYGVAGLGGGLTPTGVTPPSTATVPGGGAISDPSAALDPGYSFDVSTATEHVTQSIKVDSSGVVGGGAAPGVANAIGLGPDSVGGADRLTAQFTWSRAVAFPTVTMNYIKTLERFCGNLKNQDTFYGFAAGEVMLLRVSGRAAQGGIYNLTFEFGVRRNISNLYLVGDENAPDPPNDLVVTFAHGWDFVDVKYEKMVAAGKKAPTPAAYYVHRLYKDGDYAELNIGV